MLKKGSLLLASGLLLAGASVANGALETKTIDASLFVDTERYQFDCTSRAFARWPQQSAAVEKRGVTLRWTDANGRTSERRFPPAVYQDDYVSAKGHNFSSGPGVRQSEIGNGAESHADPTKPPPNCGKPASTLLGGFRSITVEFTIDPEEDDVPKPLPTTPPNDTPQDDPDTNDDDPPPGGTGNPNCLGIPATIVGTPQRDVIRGTAGRDIIVAFAGNDLIRSLGGNDVICTGRGNDSALGGPGQDTILGERGSDLLRGQTGNDVLLGGRGNDRLRGEANNDIMRGGRGDDDIRGGAGRDRGYGQSGKDTLIGGGLRDLLFGGPGNDTLFGNRGNDALTGNGGRDRGVGGPGRDTFRSIEIRLP